MSEFSVEKSEQIALLIKPILDSVDAIRGVIDLDYIDAAVNNLSLRAGRMDTLAIFSGKIETLKKAELTAQAKTLEAIRNLVKTRNESFDEVSKANQEEVLRNNMLNQLGL